LNTPPSSRVSKVALLALHPTSVAILISRAIDGADLSDAPAGVLNVLSTLCLCANDFGAIDASPRRNLGSNLQRCSSEVADYFDSQVSQSVVGKFRRPGRSAAAVWPPLLMESVRTISPVAARSANLLTAAVRSSPQDQRGSGALTAVARSKRYTWIKSQEAVGTVITGQCLIFQDLNGGGPDQG